MISQEDLEHVYWSTAQCYPWRVNQLGGRYVNGKPLPFETRMQILYCAKNGVRPCEISRQMKITHGCISKLLAKFKKTGSMAPGTASSETRPFAELNQLNKDIQNVPVSFSPQIVEQVENEHSFALDINKSIAVLDSEDTKEKGHQNTHFQPQRKDETKLYKHSIDEILSRGTSEAAATTTTTEEEGMELLSTLDSNIYTDDIPNRLDRAAPIVPRRSSQRTHFSRQQLQILHEEFMDNQYPGLAERQKLASKLDVKENKIRIWFSNRRAKCRQNTREVQESHRRGDEMERPCVGYPSTYCQCCMLLR